MNSVLVAIGLLGGCGDDGNGTASATDSTTVSTFVPSTSTDPTNNQPTGSDSDAITTSSAGNSNSNGDGSTTATTTAPINETQTDVTTEIDDSGPGDTTGTTTTGVEPGTTFGDTTGDKLDMPPDDSTTGPAPKGSCRPSEVYGASGGFPKFSDPAYASFLDKKVAIMTSNQQQDGWVLHVINIDGPPPPPNLNYNAPKYHNPAWQIGTIGRVFGLTLDSAGNIYVAATTVYGPTNEPGAIKRIDSVTGQVSVFATLPNNGPALGNINYDCVSETLYASSHEDGRIYQLDMAGQIVSTYRHSDKNVTLGPAADPGEPNAQFTPLGDTRVWAVQSHAGRLYYSVWKEDTGRKGPVSNEVWSVGYTDDGGIPDGATAKLEFLAPPYLGQDYSNPISDISFAATGWMLVSQRTMVNDSQTSAHQSTTYEYQYNQGTWELKGTTFIVGELQGSATGGVDHDFAENGYVWMTGDALDFGTPNVVYGLQGTPHAGGDITNSTIIDLDGEVVGQDKTAEGDVELPIPGDAMPVPEPQ